MTNPWSVPIQTRAPGARASFHCGLWALLSLVICFPVGMVLAVIAILQYQRAKRLASRNPAGYRQPAVAGLVMAILTLVCVPVVVGFGLLSAVTVPAYQQYRGRAQDRAVQANVSNGALEMLVELQSMGSTPATSAQLAAALEARVPGKLGAQLNPWRRDSQAYALQVGILQGCASEADAAQAASVRATVLGQTVFSVQAPGVTGEPGYLVAAALVRTPVQGHQVVTKVLLLQ